MIGPYTHGITLKFSKRLQYVILFSAKVKHPQNMFTMLKKKSLCYLWPQKSKNIFHLSISHSFICSFIYPFIHYLINNYLYLSDSLSFRYFTQNVLNSTYYFPMLFTSLSPLLSFLISFNYTIT